MKICENCGKEYVKGITLYCGSKCYYQIWDKKNREKRKQYKRQYYIKKKGQKRKTCCLCGFSEPLVKFGKNIYSEDLKNLSCNDCLNQEEYVVINYDGTVRKHQKQNFKGELKTLKPSLEQIEQNIKYINEMLYNKNFKEWLNSLQTENLKSITI